MFRHLYLSITMAILVTNGFAQPGSGKSMEFNGSSNYVSCGTVNLSGGQITIMGWVNFQTFKSASPYISSFIGTEIASGTNSHAAVRFGDGNLDPHKVQFILLFGSTHVKLDGNQMLEANKWYHIAATYDGTGMKIYINGILDASNTQTGSFYSNGTFEIGRNYADSRIIDGEIDEASVWSVALSQTTIRNWMCKKITTQHPNYSSLTGYWPMNEGSGSAVEDMSPNSYNGTVTGTSMWRSSGAPIGDRSKYVYANTYNIGISHPQGDSINFMHNSGTISGAHVYRVDSVPYVTSAPAPIQVLDTSHYWGIFPIGTSSYTASYYYSGNDLVANANDCNIAIAARSSGYSNAWANQLLSGVNYSNEIVTFNDATRGEYTVGISANGPHTFTYDFVEPTCNGDNDGSATVHVSGGLPPYSFAWASGSNDSTATGLNAGFHVFTVTDDNGCISIDSVLVNEPAEVVTTPIITAASCKYSANGSIHVSSSGGTSPYTYAWNDANTTAGANLSNVLPGDYMVTTTDNHSCEFVFTFTVTSTGPDPIVQLGSADTNVCEGKVFGLTATVKNGPITSYAWSTGNTSAIQVIGSAGSYALTVTNNVGCIGMDTITVNYVAPIQVDLGPDVTATGSHTVDAGIGFTAYSWNTGASSQTLLVSVSGTYTVTTTDSNQCKSNDDIKVTIKPVGVEQALSSDWAEIWPNPAEQVINVSLSGNVSTAVNFTILDLTGRVVMTGTLKPTTGQQIYINGLISAPYFINLNSGNLKKTSRFVKL